MGAFNDRRTGKDRREAKRRNEIRKAGEMETGSRHGERRIPGDRRDTKNPVTYMEF